MCSHTHLSAGSTYCLCGKLCVVQRTAAYYEWITAAGQREGKLGSKSKLGSMECSYIVSVEECT